MSYETKSILQIKSNTQHLSFFTTHSPTLTKYCAKENIFKIEDGEVTVANNIYEGVEYLIDEDDVLKTMFSSNDIIICEGKTDDIYISKALHHFREEYPTLQFDFLRVGGTDADNIKHLVDKFQVDTDKKIIILVDRDGAGEGVYKSLFPDSTTQKKDIDFKNYQDNVIFLMIPPIDTAQTGSNFQIENYFGNSVIREIAKSYVDESYTDNSSFTDLSNKLQDKVKYKLREHLSDRTKMEGFKTLLSKLLEIMT